MKTINIRFIALACLAFAFVACGSGTSEQPSEPSTQQLENMCKDVSTWCTHPWISAETESCFCICDGQDDCADSPEPSECGVLLNGQGLAAFPDGDPFVCRLQSDATKTP